VVVGGDVFDGLVIAGGPPMARWPWSASARTAAQCWATVDRQILDSMRRYLLDD
jgi:hypothetical protein